MPINSYQDFVAEFGRLQTQAKTLPLGDFPPLDEIEVPEGAPVVLIFSPHPDDEVIIGGLPLRLLRELKWRVVNVAVTQGSNKARQAERLKELKACCEHIGFELVQTADGGLENIKASARQQNAEDWASAVQRIVSILQTRKPRAIFFPHDNDWNSTHIGTNHLVADALAKLGSDFACYTVETEFWGAMASPNLMVESSARDVADLIEALTFHVGEVQRNPYHLRLPAWLIDNVRRGGELVGGQGAAAPDFLFATLYRLRRWSGGRFEDVLDKGRFLGEKDNPGALFPG